MTKNKLLLLIIIGLLVVLLAISTVNARYRPPYPKESSDGAAMQIEYEYISSNLQGVDPETGEEVPIYVTLRDGQDMNNPDFDLVVDTRGMTEEAKQNFNITVVYYDKFVNQTTGETKKANVTTDTTLSKLYDIRGVERTQFISMSLTFNVEGTWVEVSHMEVSWNFYHVTPAYLVDASVTVKDLNFIRLKLVGEILLSFFISYQIVKIASRKGLVFDFDFQKVINIILVLLIVYAFGFFGEISTDDFLLEYFDDTYTLDWWVIFTVIPLALPFNFALANQNVTRIKLQAERVSELKTSKNRKLRDSNDIQRVSHDRTSWLPYGIKPSIVRALVGPARIEYGEFDENHNFVRTMDDADILKESIWESSSLSQPYRYTLHSVMWKLEHPSLGIKLRWYPALAALIYIYYLVRNGIFDVFVGPWRFVIETLVFSVGFVILPLWILVRINGDAHPGRMMIQPEPGLVQVDRIRLLRDRETNEHQAIELDIKQDQIDRLEAEIAIRSDARAAEKIYTMSRLSLETDIKERLEKARRSKSQAIDDTRKEAIRRFDEVKNREAEEQETVDKERSSMQKMKAKLSQKSNGVN